ncbi:hypothetical protein E4634_10755 [Mangrovimicrobium sediminis]|uniref:Uncharacterized protein n=1 Tax=Mangrovimicrobium sediminis TaxID=2562682 RepID=A0A4Z0M1M0_9GAMM|nr:hypothetical protein [Haliea sp. SAOS-164]TGD73502.1 hypothetical protein E4634_10755 [Haliea sp. SAOS-164]
MPDFGPHKLLAYITPAFTAARSCLPAYRGDVPGIFAVAGLAVTLEAAGLGLIYFLVRLFTDEPLQLHGWQLWFEGVLHSPLGLTLLCVGLLSAGLRLKYRLVRSANDVAYKAGLYASRSALMRTHVLLDESHDHYGSREQRNAVSALLKEIPFACGFASGSFVLMGIHVIQAVVLSAFLLFLSPLLSLAVLLVALLAFSLLAASFESVVGVARERRDQAANQREEASRITDSLFDPAVDADAFAVEVEHALDAGSTEQWLRSRMAQRVKLRAGAMIIGFIYPVAIVFIAMLYIYTGNLAPSISDVALYFLVLRQAISSLSAIGSTFMSFSRFQHPLSNFYCLLVSGDIPDELFTGGRDTSDDE